MNNIVHVFIGNKINITDDELRDMVEMRYTEGGDRILTDFMINQKWNEYEPGCIERDISSSIKEGRELLVGASYYESFVDKLPDITGNISVLIYSPNVLIGKDYGYLRYCGFYEYLK